MCCLSFSLQPQSQNQGNICQFYSTPQGCRHGDNCRFVHHESGVSMSVNSHRTLSGRFFCNHFCLNTVHACLLLFCNNESHSMAKLQIENSSARGFIYNSSTRATGFQMHAKLSALNYFMAICP